MEVRYVYASENGMGRIPLSEVEKKVDDETVLVFASHIEYPNGLRNDIKGTSEMAYEHGSFLATCTCKYLMGLKGQVFFTLKITINLKPIWFGWASGP